LTFSDTFGRDYTSPASNANHQITRAAGIVMIARVISSHPTVCVTGAGAGVDSAWEQEKLEARKMPEMAAESPASSAPM